MIRIKAKSEVNFFLLPAGLKVKSCTHPAFRPTLLSQQGNLPSRNPNRSSVYDIKKIS